MRSSISDHDLVFAVLLLKKARPKATYITTRCFKNCRVDGLREGSNRISKETASEVLQAFSFSDPTIVSDVLSIREAVGSYLYLPLQNYFWFPDVSRIDLSRRFTRAAF